MLPGQYLICAVPDPGLSGVLYWLLFPNTREGERQATIFAREHDRPGYGIFRCISLLQTTVTANGVIDLLHANGIDTSQFSLVGEILPSTKRLRKH